MPESCDHYSTCGGFASLILIGPHPQIGDGIVTRNVTGSHFSTCNFYKSNPVQVKACPANYYVYKLVKPHTAIPMPSYCAGMIRLLFTELILLFDFSDLLLATHSTAQFPTPICLQSPTWAGSGIGMSWTSAVLRVTKSRVKTGLNGNIAIWIETLLSVTNFHVSVTADYGNYSADPCYRYTILDDPWRSTSYTSSVNCDSNFKWVGWYRMFYQGQSAMMTESCVENFRCGTHAPLWLNGAHPSLEDGIVVRAVCGSWTAGCCTFSSSPIRVKACPGNYYVYEFVQPNFCSGVYCSGKYW